MGIANDQVTLLVQATDYQIGDVIWLLGKAHRIERFEPVGTDSRIARCDDGFAMTLSPRSLFPMPAKHCPPATLRRYDATHHSAPAA